MRTGRAIMTGEDARETRENATEGGYAWYALLVLLLIYVCNFIDRQILSILAEDIKRDLQISDQQIGVLYGTVFAVFFSLFGIPLGRLADGWYRGRLISLGLLVWSGMTALSGLASTFGQLTAARIGVGIGEATAVPASYSLLGDYFNRERKGTVLGIYMAGSHVGMGLSLVVGGAIVAWWDMHYLPHTRPFGLAGWQAAFIAAGLPGFFLALWALTLREPLRGAGEGIPAPIVKPGIWKEFWHELMAIIPPLTLFSTAGIAGGLTINLALAGAIAALSAGLIHLTGDVTQWVAVGVGLYSVGSWVQTIRFRDPATFALTWGQPYVIMAIIGFGMITFLTNTATFWLSPYAMRTFGVDAAHVGASIGIPGAFASVAGILAGGRASDLLKKRDPRGRIIICMVSIVGSTIFVFLTFGATSFENFTIFAPFAYFMGTIWVSPAVTTLQDLVLPRMRGVAAATSSIGSTMIGFALGPYISGKIATVDGSLKTGVLALFIVAPLALFILYLVSRRIHWLESTRIKRARAAGEIIEAGR